MILPAPFLRARDLHPPLGWVLPLAGAGRVRGPPRFERVSGF